VTETAERGELGGTNLDSTIAPGGEQVRTLLRVLEQVGDAHDDWAGYVDTLIKDVPELVDEVVGGDFGASVASDWEGAWSAGI
jgi:hypothetical protein